VIITSLKGLVLFELQTINDTAANLHQNFILQ